MAAPGGQDTLMANKDTEVIYLVSVEKGYLALRNEPAYDESNEIARLYTGDVVEVISATGRYWFVYAPGPSLYGFADSRYLYADTVSAARDTYASYPSANTPTTVIVQSGFLALRSEPVFRDSNIIGKMYTKSDLAQFNQGQKLPQFIVTNVNTSIDSVLLPTMSKAQDDPAAVRNMTRRAIKTSTYIIMPFMVGLAVCAEPAIRLILTEKWLPCVPFLRLFCFSFAFYPIHTANLNAIKAMGRSDLFLILEILKKIVGLTAILTTMWISVLAMALSLPFTSIICQMINAWPNKKLLGYSYWHQFTDMLPQIVMSLGIGAVVYCVQLLGMNDFLTLLIQVPLGAFLYIWLSKKFHVESYSYVINTVKVFLNKRKTKES